MTVPLPVFVALPLVAAFVLPLFGTRGKGLATLLANLVTLTLLAMALQTPGKYATYEVGKWSIPLGINLVLDGLSSLMLLAISVVSAAAMLYSSRYMEQYTAKSKYLSLFLLMVAGMNGVVLSGDIFNVYVFLEVASIASYALVGFGCEHEQLEASFKYMVLGSVAGGLVLFGIALVYGNTASLNMAYISQIVQNRGMNVGLSFAMALFIAGLGLKTALVPFHAWLPDAHPAAPAPISAMLSGVLIKALGAYILCRLIFNVFGVSVSIGWVLITLAVLSMLIGGLLAVSQTDFKRLLAYSSIAQIGYIVLGVGLGALILAKGGNTTWASLAILGGLFHILNHAVSKSLLFLTSGSVEMATGTRQIHSLGGLGPVMPVTRTTCVIGSAAIAGIPPFNGFWSKLLLVIAAVQSGFYFLAAVVVIVSFFTLVALLKVQRYVFLGELPDKLAGVKENKGTMSLAMILLSVLCVFMGLLLVVPSLREAVLTPAVNVLLNRSEYAAKLIGETVNQVKI